MYTTVFCLMGPTASGKTNLACELVQLFPFEIVSVDSAMIYKEMTIGTAKPDSKTLLNAPHHLIDILDPIDTYSAALFCNDVNQLIQAIVARGNIPLLVGGTMMYFRALQQGLSLLPQADECVRAALLQEANALGWDHMHQKLLEIDPISAAKIHPHDTQRIQRALEVYQLTATPLSQLIANETSASTYSFINLMLMPEQREWLHIRIAQRFNQMLQEGFIEEVHHLIEKWALTPAHPSMRCVGYRQALAYIEGYGDYATFIEKGVAATRQLAKRQLTWLRHWQEAYFFKAEKQDVGREMIAIINQILDNDVI